MSGEAIKIQPLKSGETAAHNRVTGLSGNEIFCLKKLGMHPGNICIGNSVFALGVKGALKSGLKNLAGGEISEYTSLIHEGRMKAIARMESEAKQHAGFGVSGVTSQLINHGTNIEFLSIGSVIHKDDMPDEHIAFTTSADAQELYCQLDAGFKPLKFALGNVAYSIGVGGNIGGALSRLSRGEVPRYSEIFDTTRHLALSRITDEAKRCGANAVIGIETTLTPFLGAQEMLMIGTASHHPLLENFAQNPVTSDMTNEELWNMVHIGYMPLRLVMGVSVYSLGLAGGIKSAFQSLGRGEVDTLTTLLYEAREKALDRIQDDAKNWGADEVVGVKTHVYELGGGLIEFLAIGTAVKKVEKLTTASPALPPQAIIKDRDTFVEGGGTRNLGARAAASAPRLQGGPLGMIITAIVIFFYIAMLLLRQH